MSKKKRELIDILLDNITPDDWPEGFPFAAQDKDCTVHYCSIKPIIYPNDDEFRIALTGKYKRLSKKLELACYWNKTIVTRDEFVKRWNERIRSDDKESHADHGVKPLAFDDGPMASEPVSKSPLSTQIGGNHYTKLAIQPMRYSMENGLDTLQHTVIKYVTRFRDKAGIEDLEKAKHCIDMLIEFERESK